jgi:hypothetical protein
MPIAQRLSRRGLLTPRLRLGQSCPRKTAATSLVCVRMSPMILGNCRTRDGAGGRAGPPKDRARRGERRTQRRAAAPFDDGWRAHYASVGGQLSSRS